MKGKYSFIILLFFSLMANQTNAQYNFFVGDDAEQLNTTIKGFGSISFPSIMLNQSKIFGFPANKIRPFLSVNFGFNWKQWRLVDNSTLIRDDNGIIVVLPPPINETYTDGFFSYTKSKLATGVIRIRPEFGLTTRNKLFSIGTGPLLEFVVAAKHKRKYYELGNKEKFVKNSVAYFNLNTFQVGWGISIGTYHVGAFSYVMITPMFKEGLGPDVRAAEIGLYYRLLVKSQSKPPNNTFNKRS